MFPCMKKKPTNPNAIYQEQLQEIGTILNQAREAQALSLEEMAEQTLIRSALLRAMEKGDLDSLPEPVYVRGLIRRYGDLLGLDGETLAIQFFAPVRVRRRMASWKTSPAAQLRPLHLYAAYILVLLASVSGLSYLLRQTSPQVSNLPPLDPLSQTENRQRSAPPAANTNSDLEGRDRPLDTDGKNHPIRVEMNLTAQSWLRITADGQTQFEGILQQGDSRSWTADEKLIIRAGNAGGVMVSVNDGQAQTLGQPGMVAEVVYSPDQTIGLAF